MYPLQAVAQTRLIRPNHDTDMPRAIAVIDTEAYRHPMEDGERQTYRLGVALYLELSEDLQVTHHQMVKCPTPIDLWEAIVRWSNRNKRLFVFAHNTDYDLQLSDGLRIMKALGWQVKRAWLDDGRCVITWDRNHHRIWVVDSVFILRGSLKEIGEAIGVPKGEMPEDSDNEDDWYTYCARDVLVLAAGILEWLKFLKVHDLGSFHPTLAGQAMAAYRHRFMGEPIKAARDADVLELELEAYRGGRAEAFFIGRPKGRRFYRLDVNSMYPYVMSAHYHPVAPLLKGKGLPLRKLGEALRYYWLLAEVWVETKEPVYAVKKKDKLIFPVGRFRAVLCGEELVYAWQHDHIRKVGRFVAYKKGYPFRTYVHYFWQLRQEAKAKGNRILERNAKLMLNALYGKFGERGRVTSVVAEGEDVGWGVSRVLNATTGGQGYLISLGDVAIETLKEGVAWYASPALAASVTAAARIYLWHLIKTAGKGNVYYCDTDSLIVNEEGLKRLKPFINSEQLGLLKIEGETDNLEIMGVKFYRFGSEAKVAGLGQVIGQTEDGALKVAKWLSLKSALAGGWLGEVRLKYFPWRPQGQYEKGEVTAKGWVKPFKLKEF